jgi:hypothetical protein
VLRFLVTIIEKFCGAQSERKGGVRGSARTSDALQSVNSQFETIAKFQNFGANLQVV